jgi:hypothetical protein
MGCGREIVITLIVDASGGTLGAGADNGEGAARDTGAAGGGATGDAATGDAATGDTATGDGATGRGASGAVTPGAITTGEGVTGGGRTIDSDRIAMGRGATGEVGVAAGAGGLLIAARRSSKRRWTPRLRASMSISRKRIRERPDCAVAPGAAAIGRTSLTSQWPAITVD